MSASKPKGDFRRHFTQKPHAESNKIKEFCNYCDKHYAISNTEHLKHHLAEQCKKVPPDVKTIFQRQQALKKQHHFSRPDPPPALASSGSLFLNTAPGSSPMQMSPGPLSLYVRCILLLNKILRIIVIVLFNILFL